MPKQGSTFGGPPAALEEANRKLDELNIAPAPLTLPPVVGRRVDALTNLQKQYFALHKQYQAEIRDLDRKYEKLYDPIQDKRASIVSGAYEPTDEEAKVEKTEEEEAEEEEARKAAKPEDANVKGIPNFWLGVLANNIHVGQTIQEADEDALHYLKDIRSSELEGEEEGFTLTFHFAENPYFTNTTLTKTYHLEPEELSGDLQFDHATGSKIDWKAGKNLTVKLIKKKSKAKGKKPARVVTVEDPCDSFFSFFSPPTLPTEEEEELDEEEAELLELDFDIGCIFKDKLIPHSVLWYTGEAAALEDDSGEYEEDEEGEEGDEDEDEEEEDEDEEEEPKRGGKRQAGPGHNFVPPPGAKGGAGAPAQPQQPECKQQ